MAVAVYMVVGCPGSGKSWVCGQLREHFDYMPHDDYMMGSKSRQLYTEAILAMHRSGTRKPLLIETPFSMSQLIDPLEKAGVCVTPVFIIEKHDVIRERYRKRGSGEIPAGHLSRQLTYEQRAHEQQAFRGTSAQVLAYLKNLAPLQEHRYPWNS